MEEEYLPKVWVPFIENHRFVDLYASPMLFNIESNETFSEQKVMPTLVLASFFVYFVVAAMFFYC